MYIHEKLVRQSFERLRETEATAKRGMGRTSCLMYFLAFDEFASKSGQDVISFDPETAIGLDRQIECLSDGSGVIRLCDDDFDTLVAMLEEERQPTPALLRAGKRFKELVGPKMK